MFFSHQHLEIEIGNVKLKQYWNDQCTAVRFAQGFWSERSALAPRHGSGHTPRKSIHTQLKQYWSWNDQCGSVRTGLSVRTLGARASPRFQTPQNYIHTQLKQYWNDQCSSVRTGLSVRTLGARASSWFRTPRKYIHTQQICRPHSVPMSLVVSGLKTDTTNNDTHNTHVYGLVVFCKPQHFLHLQKNY